MYYSEKWGQWILSDVEEVRTMCSKESILEYGIEIIRAGQILVFKKGYDTFAFQTLENIFLITAKGSDLVGYEPGSVMNIRYKRTPKIIPTILFRDCRFPTMSEFSTYNRINNL